MIKLMVEDYLEDYPYWRSVTVPIEGKQLFIDGIHELGLDWKLGHEDGNGRIGLKIYCEQDDLSNLADYVDSRKGKTESFGRRKLREQDVEIEVKNKGILEVPEDKNVDDLPMSHFEKLVKKHGLSKITKALNNLQVWNKNDDKKLSKWAGNMIDKLTKKYGKNESISVKRFNEGWHNGDASISFTHNDDLEADLEEFLFDLFSDNPDVFDFDWSGKNTTLYLACGEDDYKYIKWFIEDWKYKHRDEYDEAVSRKRSTRSSGTKANSVGRFLDNMIERGKIDEKQVTVVFDKNNNIMWLGKAGFYPLFMSNIEYRSSGYDADHPHEFWINARSYTTPFEESFKRSRVTEDLEWEIIHDSDDESGNPTLWSARIDSNRYGKFIWIEKSDIGYDVVCRSGSDNWYVLDSFKSLGRAKRYVDDLLDDIDELEEAKSVEDYSHLKESGRYDYFDVPDGSFDIYDDIPDETVDTKSKDYFNFVVNDVMTRCKDEREARRYMRAKGLPKSFIDDVIKEIDKIYD